MRGASGEPYCVPPAALERILGLLNGGELAPNEPDMRPLEPGEMVKLLEGSLAGFPAKVERVDRDQATVAINVFKRWSRATIPVDQLERV